MRFKEDNFYINQVLQGKTFQFRYIIEKHKSMAYNLAYRICKNIEDTEEVTQDAFISIFNNLNAFNQQTKLSTWLYKIIYNASISKVRGKKPQFISLETDESAETYFQIGYEDSNFVELEKIESKEQINQAIEMLKSDEAGIINLYYFEENTLEEISIITGISSSNLKVKLFRIRKKLLENLKNIMKNEFEIVYGK